MISQQAAEELPPEKLQEFKDIFSFFDRDGGGSIGAEEFDQVRLIYEKNVCFINKTTDEFKSSLISGIQLLLYLIILNMTEFKF